MTTFDTSVQPIHHPYLDFTIPTLIELSDERCRELLQARRWGRLATGGGIWPSIHAINYVFDGTDLVFRTTPSTHLSDGPMMAVAVEIDDASPDGSWGWSVLLQGPALDITDAHGPASTRLRSYPVIPWAPGNKDRWIKVIAARLTGRAFGAIPSVTQ